MTTNADPVELEGLLRLRYAEISELKAKIERLMTARNTLFDAIAHGDDVHREWLREAIDAHFAGKPVPQARDALEGKP